MATEDLDRNIWPHLPDRLLNEGQGASRRLPKRIMTDQDEHVDRLMIIDCIFEPLLLNHLCCRDDFRGVRVALEIEEDAKCHDAKPVIRMKVSVLVRKVLVSSSSLVVDLNVRRDIAVTVGFGKLVGREVGDVGQIQLMITDRQQIIIDLLENRIAEHAIGRFGVAKTVPIVEIACIDDKHINAHGSRLDPHFCNKATKITPIGAIVLFLQMALQPACYKLDNEMHTWDGECFGRKQRILLTMGVGRVKNIELTPCQGSTRIVQSTWCRGLHALHLTNVLTWNCSSIAAAAMITARKSQAGVDEDKMKEPHDHVAEAGTGTGRDGEELHHAKTRNLRLALISAPGGSLSIGADFHGSSAPCLVQRYAKTG